MLLNNPKNAVQAAQLPVNKLRPFEGHPFQVKDDAEMEQLVWSILTQGLLTPITVRPIENNEYEVISGHRRLHACQKARIETVPALIYALDRDAAAIALVDSNLHREKILPSEKAFAYKLKMDSMSRQGQRTDLTSRQVVGKLETADLIADNESGRQVQRYIRLTELIPEILQMVDDGKIALTPAVELSKLHWQTQQLVYEICDMDDLTPSYSQTVRMRKLADEGALGEDAIREIMSEEKANQRERIVIYMDDIRQYYPRKILPKDIVSDIQNLLHKRRAVQ